MATTAATNKTETNTTRTNTRRGADWHCQRYATPRVHLPKAIDEWRATAGGARPTREDALRGGPTTTPWRLAAAPRRRRRLPAPTFARHSVRLLEGGARAAVGMQGRARGRDSNPATNDSRRDENDSTAAAGGAKQGPGRRRAVPLDRRHRSSAGGQCSWQPGSATRTLYVGPCPPSPSPHHTPSRPKPTNMQ
jgi:hypothetical protein